MKTIFLSSLVFLLFIGAGSACAKEYQAKKKIGDLEVEMRMDRDPPVLGDNKVRIEIKDRAGNTVKDVKVLVNYYMPPMPRMAPMNYKTDATLKGNQFQATMRFIMSGPWYVVVIIEHGGKHSSAKFNLQVP